MQNISGTDFRHLIRAGSATIIVSRKSSGADSVHYVTSDHLGSSSTVSGTTLNASFDAFGRRRGAAWTGNPSSGDWSAIASTTRRGYTEHSMLDNLELIHMNGRVQDPVLGRFLSADPYIPDPLSTQSYNRYSYVQNNPLSFTDPSGFNEIPSAADINRRRDEDRRRFSSFPPPKCNGSTNMSNCLQYIGAPCMSYGCDFSTLFIGNGSMDALGAAARKDPLQGEGIGFDDAVSFGFGYTPAGTIADVYTAISGEDFFTGEEVDGFWRWGGILPFASELRKLNKVLNPEKLGGRFDELSSIGAHRHHIPAAEASPLPRATGPAIRMDPADHRRTASYGGGAGSPQQQYRDRQRELIEQGRFDDAFLMDVDDIQSKFGNKYDQHLIEAMDALP